MAKITNGQLAISAGVGLLDNVLAEVDIMQGYVDPVMNTRVAARTAMAVGGFAANWMNIGPRGITETVTIAAIPLLIDSARIVIKSYMAAPAQRFAGPSQRGYRNVPQQVRAQFPNPSPMSTGAGKYQIVG